MSRAQETVESTFRKGGGYAPLTRGRCLIGENWRGSGIGEQMFARNDEESPGL